MTDNIKYLLKFGNQENIEALFNKGEVFMNTIKYFQELERLGVGDKYEGTFEISNFKNGELSIENPENLDVLKFKTTRLQLRKKMKDNIGNIFSTYALSNKLLITESLHKIDKRLMLECGTHCLIIKDVRKFISSVMEKLDENGFSSSQNLISYYDYDKNHNLTFFDKSDLFSYQNEHRIIAYTTTDKPLKFEIGSMRNYAEIYLAEDIINKAVFSQSDPNIIPS